jgi:hypothetical protein
MPWPYSFLQVFETSSPIRIPEYGELQTFSIMYYVYNGLPYTDVNALWADESGQLCVNHLTTDTGAVPMPVILRGLYEMWQEAQKDEE